MIAVATSETTRTEPRVPMQQQYGSEARPTGRPLPDAQRAHVMALLRQRFAIGRP
jgi:hypothetical protein